MTGEIVGSLVAAVGGGVLGWTLHAALHTAADRAGRAYQAQAAIQRVSDAALEEQHRQDFALKRARRRGMRPEHNPNVPARVSRVKRSKRPVQNRWGNTKTERCADCKGMTISQDGAVPVHVLTGTVQCPVGIKNPQKS